MVAAVGTGAAGPGRVAAVDLVDPAGMVGACWGWRESRPVCTSVSWDQPDGVAEYSASALELVLASFGDEAALEERTAGAAVVGVEGVVAAVEGHSSKALRLGQGHLPAARSAVVVRCSVSVAALREAQGIVDSGEEGVGVNRSLVDDVNANHAYGAGGALPSRAPCPHPCRVRVGRSLRRRSPGRRK